MGEAKPEESLCTLDIAVVVADNHHVVLVPGQQSGHRDENINQDDKTLKMG